MPLSDWAQAAYARPAVARACLGLQDDHGQNVCLMLWAMWARPADPVAIARAAATARLWDAAAVSPLRAVRRGLKAPHPPIEDAAREALREQVKAAELAAERALLQALDDRCASGWDHGGDRVAADPPCDGRADCLAALQAVAAAWGRTVPEAALADLINAFE
jgi:uncharacterized protein (TIGR02444 family)